MDFPSQQRARWCHFIRKTRNMIPMLSAGQCPFCGGIKCFPKRGRAFYIHCDTCLADGPEKPTPIGAREAWNERTAPEEVAIDAALEHAKVLSLYHQLIFSVGKCYEGETRHETALRYVLQAEQPSGEAEKAKTDLK